MPESAARNVPGPRLLLWLLWAAAMLPTTADAVDFQKQRFAMALGEGREVMVELRLPEQATAQPLPAVMVFAGFEAAGHVLDFINPPAPIILASFAYPVDLPFPPAGPGEALTWLPEVRRAVAETLEGIGLLHRHLAAMATVDAERITVAGISLGAPFATVAAARHDIPAVAIVHGFAEVDSVVAGLLARYLEARIGRAATPVSRLLARLLGWYLRLPDIAQHAARLDATQRVLVIDAARDHIVPPQSRAALHDGLARSQAQVERVTTPGGHVYTGAEETIALLLQHTLDWMQRHDLLGPQPATALR